MSGRNGHARNGASLLRAPSYTALGYRAARVMRAQPGATARGGSADSHIRTDLSALRAQSQEFDRDNSIYRGVLSRAVDNILGDGFTLQARTDNRRLNEKIEKTLWPRFAASPEVRGLLDWSQLERVVLRSVLVDGDIGAVLTNEGLVQLVESEQITTGWGGSRANNTEQGVELDPVGRPVAYHVAEYDAQGGSVRSTRSRRIPAEWFIFLASLDRPSQTRGVPPCTACFPMLHRIDDVCNSEAAAWQLLSRMAVAYSVERPADMAMSMTTAREDENTDDAASRYTVLDDAMLFFGKTGESVKGIDRNLPGANFPASVTMFLRLLGLPLGMPLELILLDWSKTNYSSARAALEQAFRMFKCWQKLLRRCFHAKVYRWLIASWSATGDLSESEASREDIFAHEWICPSFPWIDQLKEAQAWGARIDRGLTTYGEAAKSLDRDRGELVEARKIEVLEAIAAADEINAQHPAAKVDWRMFAGLEPAIGAVMSAAIPGSATVDPVGPDESAVDSRNDDEEKTDGED